MNTDLNKLQPYPFERLRQLKENITPPKDKTHIALSIGEPKHPPPDFVFKVLQEHLTSIANYPVTKGLPELRQAIVDWLLQRYLLPATSLDANQHVLPVNGTREALFAFAQAVVQRKHQTPGVLMPNPFYQIYEGAALLAGATPYFFNTTASKHFQIDIDAIPEHIWQDCQLIYICSPGNPTGAVYNKKTLRRLLELAHQYDFIIASDECYSEIYFSAPPTGLLEVAAEYPSEYLYQRCVVFHSLSKRSNLPGLRSGFVAGDPNVLAQFLLYRTYHGCAMSLPTQYASIAAWKDEQHVIDNRHTYQQKFTAVLDILSELKPIPYPEAGFYLWLETPEDDQRFAQRLFQQQHITVLPGSYLSRPTPNGNPGKNYIRMALVATLEECVDAAERIKTFMT